MFIVNLLRREWIRIDFPAGDGTNKKIYGKFPLLS